MIFVDTNVFMYAVGRAHPLRREARTFFESSVERGESLMTSAEVQQELMHAYLPVDRLATLDAALTLTNSMTEIWPIEPADVAHTRVPWSPVMAGSAPAISSTWQAASIAASGRSRPTIGSSRPRSSRRRGRRLWLPRRTRAAETGWVVATTCRRGAGGK